MEYLYDAQKIREFTKDSKLEETDINIMEIITDNDFNFLKRIIPHLNIMANYGKGYYIDSEYINDREVEKYELFFKRKGYTVKKLHSKKYDTLFFLKIKW